MRCRERDGNRRNRIIGINQVVWDPLTNTPYVDDPYQLLRLGPLAWSRFKACEASALALLIF